MNDTGVRLDRDDTATRANEICQQQSVVAEIGAHIDRHHAWPNNASDKLGQPHLPEAVEQNIRSKSSIPRVDIEFVSAKNTAYCGVITEEYGLYLSATQCFQYKAIFVYQFAKRDYRKWRAYCFWDLDFSRRNRLRTLSRPRLPHHVMMPLADL
jgi:hypothetical protein